MGISANEAHTFTAEHLFAQRTNNLQIALNGEWA